MRRIAAALFAAGLALAPLTATAQAVRDGALDVSNLTPAQKAQLAADAAKAAADNEAAKTNAPTQQAQRVSEYVQIGKGIAEGLGAAAHQLNVEVNSFATSPVGQITTALIVYKVIGHDVLHIVWTLLWLIVSVSIWLFFYGKLYESPKIVTEFYENGKKKSVTKVASYNGVGDMDANWSREEKGGLWWTRLIGLVPIPVIVIVTFILMP